MEELRSRNVVATGSGQQLDFINQNQVVFLIENRFTDSEMAQVFGVSVRTIRR